VVGVGHVLWGDDGVGPAAVQALHESLPVNDRLQYIDAGPAPENYTGKLREFRPDIVLLVDAAEMDLLPGSYRCIDLSDLDGFSASGHSLPLSVISAYLQVELNCRILLIGIQPETLAFGAGLTDSVQGTVSYLTGELKNLIEESLSANV
jgi:hydrogenase 3 maturation protease